MTVHPGDLLLDELAYLPSSEESDGVRSAEDRHEEPDCGGGQQRYHVVMLPESGSKSADPERVAKISLATWRSSKGTVAADLLNGLVALAQDREPRRRPRRPRYPTRWRRRSTSRTTQAGGAFGHFGEDRSGSSERGLSLVRIARSAAVAARPIRGRFSRSRSPPAPTTAITLPDVIDLATALPPRRGDVGIVDDDLDLTAAGDLLETTGHDSKPCQPA